MKKETLTLNKGKIGYFSLTLLALSSTIGSGWYFGAFRAAKVAGPISILSWIIGGIAILLIVLATLEIATMFPKAGGLTNYINITHGPIAGFISAFSSLLLVAAVIAFEAGISTKYLATLSNWGMFLLNEHTGELTKEGILFSVFFIFIYFFINYFSLSFFVKFNNLISLFKIIVPVVTAFTFIIVGFTSPSHAPLIRKSFAPYGFNAALTAITSCGIIFSYNGFQSILSLAEEAKDPEDSLPLAIISAIVFSIILYVLLQISFIIAVSPDTMAIENWQNLSFNSPFAQLAMVLNMNFILILLYANTVVSPSGTGIVHFASSSRILYGMCTYKQMPKFIKELNPKYLIPRKALISTLLISIVILLLFNKFKDLIGGLSVACVITYFAGPIATSTLRKDAPGLKRPFRLPLEKIISPFTFVLCTFFIYWAQLNQIVIMIAIIFAGLVLYFILGYRESRDQFKNHLKSSLWFICYLIALTFMSYLGSKDFGGFGYIPNIYDTILNIIIALFFFYWAINSGCYKETECK